LQRRFATLAGQYDEFAIERKREFTSP